MTATAAKLREKASQCEAARAESFERCDTDGFVSQWCHGLNAQLYKRRAELVEAGDQAEFRGLFRREDGARVAAKLINGKFGYCWAFCDENGNFTGRFISDSKGTKRSRMYREGFEVRMEMAPAAAKIEDNGAKGFSGLGSCFVRTFRTDGGFPANAEVV